MLLYSLDCLFRQSKSFCFTAVILSAVQNSDRHMHGTALFYFTIQAKTHFNILTTPAPGNMKTIFFLVRRDSFNTFGQYGFQFLTIALLHWCSQLPWWNVKTTFAFLIFKHICDLGHISLGSLTEIFLPFAKHTIQGSTRFCRKTAATL